MSSLFLEEVEGFLDLHLKAIVVQDVLLDLRNGQVNQHAGDLGRQFFTNYLLDVLVDELSDLVPVVRVLWDDSRIEVHA